MGTTVAILGEIGGGTRPGGVAAGRRVRHAPDRRPPEGSPGEYLYGIRLLLLAPTLSSESRENLLAEMADALEAADIPVLTLSRGLKEALGDGRASIAWPCRLEDLTKKIEATLLPVPEVGNI